MDLAANTAATSREQPSTQATDPISSSVIEQRVESLRREKRAVAEAAAPGATESTIAVSSDAVERMLEARRAEKIAPLPNSVRGDEDTSVVEAFPITQLATGHLLCRILVIEEQGSLQVPGAERIQVHREVEKGDVGAEKGKDGDDKGASNSEQENEKGKEKESQGARNNEDEKGKNSLFAECLAATQGPDDICCRIESPLQFELYYDSQKDSLQAVSKIEMQIRIEPITYEDQEPDQARILERFDYRPVGPGAWRFSSADGLRSLQAIIFPRQHSLALVKLKTLSAVAGTKRDAPTREDQAQAAAETGPVATNEVIKRLDSLAELAEGQMLHVISNEETEYSLFRMALLGKTRSAQVFQARHSDFPNKLVVVKAFMYGNRYNAVDRGRLWQAEYRIHRKLKSDVIVELFGADARLEALVMDSVDARDLSSARWCDVKGDKKFLGTEAQAKRVLIDMSRALLHLRQKGVLHNDIKPSNILFGEQRGGVLIDFGLATVDMSPPSTGGTPWYVPREFLEHFRRAAEADVWALGVVMAYLMGCIPLPDSERQVKSWPIRDIVHRTRDPLLPPTPARARMTQWLGIVDNIRNKMESNPDDYLGTIVSQMLLDEENRITAEELEILTSSLDLGMAG